MTCYLPEPTTAAEVIARARAVEDRRKADHWRPQEPPRQRLVVIEQIAAWRRVLNAREDARRRAAEEAALRAEERKPIKVRPVKEIIAEVSAETGISIALIVGQRRAAPIMAARFEAIKRVAEETGYSLTRIGAAFGGRDHTTILNALKRSGVQYKSKCHPETINAV